MALRGASVIERSRSGRPSAGAPDCTRQTPRKWVASGCAGALASTERYRGKASASRAGCARLDALLSSAFSSGLIMATYVLIHGAWHGGWCWRSVAPALRRAGHEVYAPSLTGLGERKHLAHG